ncbi:hypothetical protein LU293_03395 [Moraxella nasovis]|uniref:hypothetical protein n=1 Tax=Moraxella nasovis TaxID=2904121 RepID=UPI001F600998|nr:hypothetical protein [Moraxella nasovis]UNU73954.1 hypothetical protein LU293_03395 [Moraxella nasovis]
MNLLNKIILIVGGIISTALFGLYFYKLYDKSFEKANPYLYQWKYYDLPNKEKMAQVVDELTDFDRSYLDEDYFRKADHYYFSRYFAYDKSENVMIKIIADKKFVVLEVDEKKIFCLKDGMYVEFKIDEREFFGIHVFWSPRSECRKHWWGGKNPRALQDLASYAKALE